MSTVTVRMNVKPEKEEEFLQIFRDVIAIVEAEEDDCHIYALWETGEPYEYFLVEGYRNEAARTAHNERHKSIGPNFFACLEGPPEVLSLSKQLMGIPR
ncbi:MAG: antibiotic biosynthesis monooxygenase family protein [Pseudomonadota bacterium]